MKLTTTLGAVVGLVSLLVAVGAAAQPGGQGGGQGVQATPIPAEELPTVEETFASFVEAIGGEEAVRSVTSRRFVGRVRVLAQGREDPLQVGRIEIMAEAPGTLIQDVIYPGQGTVRTVVYDGTVWQIDEEEQASLTDEATAARQRVSARFYQQADWEEMYADVAVLGGLEQGELRVVQLSATHHDGRVEVLTFDLNSGLLLMISGERPSPLDASQIVPFRRAYENYEETDGVLYARRVVEQAGRIGFEIEVTRVETGIEMPEIEVPDFDAESADE